MASDAHLVGKFFKYKLHLFFKYKGKTEIQ
jgi:hypothetical protein